MLNSTTPPSTWHESVRAFKRELIERALGQTSGNRTQAARLLGLQRTYLLRLMRDLELPPSRDHDGGHSRRDGSD